MQLVAYGAQDIYLTGNPQITFFKVVYRRHTNFAIEAIEQTFNGSADFGSKVVCTISRNGDLVSNMYLEIDLENGNPVNGSVRNGHKLINYIEVEIGGQTIDKHYGEWLDIWTQLSSNEAQLSKQTNMLSGNLRSSDSENTSKIYVPLQFWFNKNPGLALPLIALQYHEVKISIEFNKKNHIKASTLSGVRQGLNDDCKLSNLCLFCDYIFLDTDERRRFAQVSHEYLIDQVQTTGTSSYAGSTNKINLNLDFNHPVKELVWVVQNSELHGTFDYSASWDNNIWNPTTEFVSNAKLQLNGQDRFRAREGSYFRIVQPSQHHTGGHRQPLDLQNLNLVNLITNANDAEVDLFSKEFGHINAYSFALRPEEHQPSGTCNFSRIDNALLNMELNSGHVVKVVGEKNSEDIDAKDALNNLLKLSKEMNETSDRDHSIVLCWTFYNNLKICWEKELKDLEINKLRLEDLVNLITNQSENTLDEIIETDMLDNNNVFLEKSNDKNVRVYATNYNVLRIMSGMGGLAYSN